MSDSYIGLDHHGTFEKQLITEDLVLTTLY